MKKMLCIVSIFVLVITSYSFGQDVAVVYDARLELGGSLGVPNPIQLADLLVEKFNDEKLMAEIVDADGLVEYMEENPKGIFILIQGNIPDTIYQNKGNDDPIYSWLREGGIGGFMGDFPFYYYWDFNANERVTATGAGQQKIFGHQVTQSQDPPITVNPTDLGKQYIPSLEQWITNRAVSISLLEQNGFEYESYSDNGAFADPVAFKTNDMEGWFINFHTSCCGTILPGIEQLSSEYVELISNRFATESQSVDPLNKVSVVWGALKSQR